LVRRNRAIAVPITSWSKLNGHMFTIIKNIE
jgi:hypothetical protein